MSSPDPADDGASVKSPAEDLVSVKRLADLASVKSPAEDLASLRADSMLSLIGLVDSRVVACPPSGRVGARPCRSDGKDDGPGEEEASDMREIRRKVDCRSGRETFFVARDSSEPRPTDCSLAALGWFISDNELRVLVGIPTPTFCGNGGTGGIGEPRPESGVMTISPPLMRLSFQ